MAKAKSAVNVARQMKAGYSRMAKPGKSAPALAGRPMKTVVKARMQTRRKP